MVTVTPETSGASITITPEEGGSPIVVAVAPESQPIEVSLGSLGPQGPIGPAGPASSTYLHHQSSALAVWTIAHNLGFRPAVAVTTDGGLEVVADVLHLSDDVLTVTFLSATTGYARLS